MGSLVVMDWVRKGLVGRKLLYGFGSFGSGVGVFLGLAGIRGLYNSWVVIWPFRLPCSFLFLLLCSVWFHGNGNQTRTFWCYGFLSWPKQVSRGRVSIKEAGNGGGYEWLDWNWGYGIMILSGLVVGGGVGWVKVISVGSVKALVVEVGAGHVRAWAWKCLLIKGMIFRRWKCNMEIEYCGVYGDRAAFWLSGWKSGFGCKGIKLAGGYAVGYGKFAARIA
ncbi:hypothetical protein HanPI659440_Chr13g0511581 [Helianthus annuus]|nr:hypothetical protein HanPI659440_Chr13g0511581 [Helianthus annuus]